MKTMILVKKSLHQEVAEALGKTQVDNEVVDKASDILKMLKHRELLREPYTDELVKALDMYREDGTLALYKKVLLERCLMSEEKALIHEELPEILERFSTTLINCEAEFKRHLPEKGETWLQDGTDWLFTNVLKVAAKLLLAEDPEAQLDEAIDLILSAMMLAERYLRDADKDEDEIPFLFRKRG